MTPSNFSFLEEEFPFLFNIGQSAEFYLHPDPVASLFKTRLFAERLTEKLFEAHQLEFPQDNSFHSRLKTLQYTQLLPFNIRDLFFSIKDRGNVAVHQHQGSLDDAKSSLFGAFRLSKWFYETYSGQRRDISAIKFHMPPNLDARHALHVLENEYRELEERFARLLAERQTTGLPAEKQQELQQRSIKAAGKLEMTEAETRELIDGQLRSMGWEADTATLNYKKHKTTPQRNRHLAIAEWPAGPKWADYALFVGQELYALVEAKKYAQDISTNLDQAKIYAELVEEKHEALLTGAWGNYKVPFLFSTNGRPYLEQIKTKSGIWFLDVRRENNISRPLQGWYRPEGLVKLLQQDTVQANEKLKNTPLDFLASKSGLGLRAYQLRAIKAVEQKLIQQPHDRRALIAMATGTGKTRTVIGLCYHLIQTNRFNRILFLVDRTLLGTQALHAFKDNKVVDLNTFADVYEVKELKDLLPDADTRLQFATVQSMVKRLFYSETDEKTPSVDQYDCIIIDEAHRGYLLDKQLDEEELHFKDQQDYISKYRMVLDYFDAYAIGLTATPALHTKEIFGSAVYTYSYREAVVDGFLIDHDPPYLLKTKLNEEGMRWQKGEKPKALDKETNSIVALEELEDELQIDVAGFNKLVLTESFNRTVVQQLVKELDPEGEEKTLIFAATDNHAELVVQLLKEEFHAAGIEIPDNAVEKITGQSYDPDLQVKRFKNEQYPNIAVTVDLLTTGVDVPAICNIVFLRKVKSRILYEQMLGRATRLCPGIRKESFRIYDAVRLYETLQDYTQMKPVVADPKATFEQLAHELQHIVSEERARRQLEQLVAKLRRKKQKMNGHQEEQFRYTSGGLAPEDLMRQLLEQPLPQSRQQVLQWSGLWQFLDELKPAPPVQYVSEHQDEYLKTERGYGKGQRPEDYLESFGRFIQEKQNEIAALHIICTNPKELNRQTLKELYLALDLQGFNTKSLKAAWKEARQQDVAADIIAFIRTLAMGTELESHEARIKRAVDKVRAMREWTKTQLNWLNRFEKQLLAETVLHVEDLNEDPFKNAGGFQKLDKVFEHQLKAVIDTINDNLYPQSA